jgi:hypothetical protein
MTRPRDVYIASQESIGAGLGGAQPPKADHRRKEERAYKGSRWPKGMPGRSWQGVFGVKGNQRAGCKRN